MVWIFVLLATLAVTVGLLVLRHSLRRRRRIKVRLLGGQSHLRGEEIEARSQELERFESEEFASACLAAEAALDELNVSLLDRQAQLQNYEDLASLQRHKIAVLEWSMNQPLEDADPAAAESEAAVAGHQERAPRGDIEQSLLAKIEEAQRRRANHDT